jgi:hypothetical protein
MIISLPVQIPVVQYRPVGALVVLVAVQVSVPGWYLPPVMKNGVGLAVALAVAVAVAVGPGESNGAGGLPPVLKKIDLLSGRLPPAKMSISLPVHAAACEPRAEGALVVLVIVQLSVLGLYLPPVLKKLPSYPPQTIISLSLHTAV